MIYFRSSIDTGRLWIYLFRETGELASPEDLHLFGTSMQMRHRRQLSVLMVEMLMEEILWCSLQSMAQMQKKFIKEGSLHHQAQSQREGPEVGALLHALGTVMTERGNLGDAHVRVIGMNGINIETRTETTIVAVVAEVPAPFVVEVGVQAG